jgi:monofunctional glycosyltransferase
VRARRDERLAPPTPPSPTRGEGGSFLGRMGRAIRKIVLGSVLFYIVFPPVAALTYLAIPPPLTPLMVIRLFEGEGIQRHWTPIGDMAPGVVNGVIAAEDNLFCEHMGFDWRSLEESWDRLQDGKRARGASTISMQTAKNLFLWDGRSFVRKALEPYPTLVIELLWSKRKIMEVYLNIAEWGPGVYGVGAAAEHHFGKTPDKLTRREGALLAAVLPNPRAWSAGKPSAYIAGRAATIQKRVGQLGTLLDCVKVE